MSLSTQRLEFPIKNVKELTSKQLNAYPNLTELIVTDSEVKTIDPNAFIGCTKLKSLFLAKNHIHFIFPNTFRPCENLKLISLSFNKIVCIDKETFAHCHQLEKLWLDSNELSSIDTQAFRNCRALQEVRLHNNHLRSIHPDMFTDCPQLTTLSLHGNDIQALVIFQLNQLRSLSLFSANENKLEGMERTTRNAILIDDDRTLKFDSEDFPSISYCVESSNDEILKYIVEHFLKHSRLFEFLEKCLEYEPQNLSWLNRILKLNSIWNIFSLDELSNQEMQTLLHLASIKKYAHLTQLLCAYGADKDAQDANGVTPMQLALDGMYKECVKTLIEYGSSRQQALEYCQKRNLSEMGTFLHNIPTKRDSNEIINLVFQGKKLNSKKSL